MDRSVPLRVVAFRGSVDEPPRACGVSSTDYPQESTALRCTALLDGLWGNICNSTSD
ncbi:hypothetical protein [Rossellomorea marisflavi]|uniref:hypothetical protein n=1 Tax=Rossellomorea marisflavi TaxID=189381 RepID=UPI00295E7786|nr:hypothetical protein [Rossellomorea marisflavi]